MAREQQARAGERIRRGTATPAEHLAGAVLDEMPGQDDPGAWTFRSAAVDPAAAATQPMAGRENRGHRFAATWPRLPGAVGPFSGRARGSSARPPAGARRASRLRAAGSPSQSVDERGGCPSAPVCRPPRWAGWSVGLRSAIDEQPPLSGTRSSRFPGGDGVMLK